MLVNQISYAQYHRKVTDFALLNTSIFGKYYFGAHLEAKHEINPKNEIGIYANYFGKYSSETFNFNLDTNAIFDMLDLSLVYQFNFFENDKFKV